MFKPPYCLLALLVVPATSQAQECNAAINATTPTHRFVIHDNGTVTDVKTGLTWQRCPVGYNLDNRGTSLVADDVCEPEDISVFDWQAALQHAGDLNAGGGSSGYTDWRVPNVKELVSIVEYQCYGPALNSVVFPAADTITDIYWSSTPRKVSSPAYVDFGLGTYSYAFIGEDYQFSVRLVRNDI